MRFSALLMLAGLAASAAMGANIVTNPGFETGDLTGWTVNSDSWFVDTTDPSPHSGTYSAQNGCVGTSCISTLSGGSWMYQDLPTVAGTTYSVSFWFDPGTLTIQGSVELAVFFGGSEIYDIVPNGNGGVDPGYTLFTANGLLATSNSTELEFVGRQDPSYLAIDDIDVEGESSGAPPSGVPEPTTMALLGSGLAGMGLLRYRRRS